jgi:hypothetical protein
VFLPRHPSQFAWMKGLTPQAWLNGRDNISTTAGRPLRLTKMYNVLFKTRWIYIVCVPSKIPTFPHTKLYVFTSNNCWWHKRTIGSMKFAVWWTLQMCLGIGKIQLCHYNLVWGKSGYFWWHTGLGSHFPMDAHEGGVELDCVSTQTSLAVRMNEGSYPASLTEWSG